MLKCIHKTPVFSEKLIKFSTDFHRHYLLFGENKAHLYDVDGNALSQFECKGGMREGVFADNRAIVATDEGTLNFYNIKERTSKIVKRSVHGLLPGPGFASFYIVTHRGRGLDLALIGSTEKNPVLRMDGVSSIFSGLKRFFTGVIEPSELSILHSKSKSYICNKTNKVFIYCGSKLDKTLDGFPLPIYKVVETPLGDIYLGVEENIVRGFFEDMRERFTNEFPFYVKEVLATDKNIIVVCSYGTIFVLNLVGDITDGGFIGKEIIDCHISSDGLLWCLLEDGSLMIITLDPQESPEISQLIDLSIRENRTPLQEALLKEVELQSELRKLSRKTKELNVFESKLKMESKKLATLSNKAKKREKLAEAKLKDVQKLEAEIPKLDNVETLSIKLKELEQKAIQDKTQLAAREAEINKITQEIKTIEELKEALILRLKDKTDTIAKSKAEIDRLTQEEQRSIKDSESTNKRVSELKKIIEGQKVFLMNAPEQIRKLEEDEKSHRLKINEINGNILSLKQKIDTAKREEEELKKKLSLKNDELRQVLESAKIVHEREKNIPEIYKLSQQLINLIDKTQINEGGDNV